jgi:hypothetical protein
MQDLPNKTAACVVTGHSGKWRTARPNHSARSSMFLPLLAQWAGRALLGFDRSSQFAPVRQQLESAVSPSSVLAAAAPKLLRPLAKYHGAPAV